MRKGGGNSNGKESLTSNIETNENYHPPNQEENKMEQLTSRGSFDSVSTVVKPKTCRVRKMYLASLASLTMSIAIGMASGYSAPATYDMTTDPNSRIKPNNNEVTWIGSILALGAMSGGLVTGPMADKLGRKHVLMLNVVPFVIGWGFIFYANNVTQVLIGRFLCGMCCGVVSVSVPMYTVEISTPEVRGLLGSSYQGFLVIGNLFSMVIGAKLSWPWLAYCAACMAITGMIVLFPMPESPRWLVAKGRIREAVRAINFLQGDYLDAVEECRIIEEDLKNQPKVTFAFAELWRPEIYKPALLTFSLMFFQQLSGANSVFFYSTSIFDISKDLINPKTATIIIAAVQVVATLMSNFLVDKTGRKILLLSSGFLMAVSLIALGTYYRISTHDETFKVSYAWLPLASLVVFTVAFSIGYGPVPPLIMAEMVPVKCRSLVGGFAIFINGLFGFMVTKTFGQLQDGIGSDGAFWTYSGMSLVGCVFVGFLLPETKGKRLEDMKDIFTKKKPLLQTESSVFSINV